MGGQLGIDGYGSSTPCLLEEILDSSKDESLKMVEVKAGGSTSAAIDSNGGLWIWGNRPEQSLSRKDSVSMEYTVRPTLIRYFAGHFVVKVACGNNFIVALASLAGKGEDDLMVYSWGKNLEGQLGLGHNHDTARPENVVGFGGDSPWVAYDVACGDRHTAVLARKKGQQENGCWTFGLGFSGQLGQGTAANSSSPVKVKGLPNSIRLLSVDCGDYFTSVISASGDVWAWGSGLDPEGAKLLSPFPFRSARENGRFERPVQVACGFYHIVLIACGGSKLWSWGRGHNGMLGNGFTVDCFTPTPVSWPELLVDQQVEQEEDEEKSADNKENECEGDEQLQTLKRRLLIMEGYASVLHCWIFGKPFDERNIPVGDFDASKKWKSMVESADGGELVALERVYESMLSGVKDRLMKINDSEGC